MAAHPHWDIALKQTAPEDEGSAAELQAPVAETTMTVPLTDQGVIHVSGGDAAGFLHAQLSNSIEDLDVGASRLAAWCSPKGRTLALFRVVAAHDGFIILLDRSIVEATLKRLRLFVLRADVTLTDRSDDWAAVGVAGPDAAAKVAAVAGAAPTQPESVAGSDDCFVLCAPGSETHLVVLGPASTIIGIWHRLRDEITAAEPQAWHLRLIREGIPTITQATRDQFVPQMLNLEPLGGLNFSKGCYPGQEVVARLHYRGRLKRRIYRLQIPLARPPEPGTLLDDGDSTVVDAACCGDTIEALAVIDVERADTEALSYDGQPATLAPLPYTMTTA